jgi:hypothetical protein
VAKLPNLTLSAPTDLSDLDFLRQADVSLHRWPEGKVHFSDWVIDQK